jgi:hypothetical protein
MLMPLMMLAIVVIFIAGMWRMFSKAGKPGWACIVPIYNVVVMLQIAGRPVWWLLLFFIPFVNVIVGIMVAFDIARAFGKGAMYGIGLAFFGFIFYPLLGFGDADYVGVPAR